MIVIDIQCINGHTFEGWFDSIQSFEEQNLKKLVSCPYCEGTEIKRVLSPVALKRAVTAETSDLPPIDYERLAKEVVDYIYKNSDDVGSKFAAEALKMHYGVTEKRNIRGSATSDEEKTLKDEGIIFFKFPTPKTDDDKTN
ncbi:conserved hypothetical protein [uncultured Desulfobacterium sp.]|uniref:DUF1178 domain-containing protein n=1 Tax=uncultured Desulfobacterium sp. TaxID=201089 RepID=A0A445N3F9_9BACT|nr:conserved hypothetical protein [uncultured Desulfobacterium sp.]